VLQRDASARAMRHAARGNAPAKSFSVTFIAEARCEWLT
jgi:hypothetical protein